MHIAQREYVAAGLVAALVCVGAAHSAAVTVVTDTPSGKPWHVLENEFLRVAVSPAHDGRVASLVDKRTGKDYAWWGLPDKLSGGFCAHRLRGGCSGHEGTPMKARLERGESPVRLTVDGDVSPSFHVSKTYELSDGASRLDVTLRVRNLDRNATPKFMPTVHNMMAQGDMESTFCVPMPDSVVIQPLDFWHSPANNFYEAPGGAWYGFVGRDTAQGLAGVFEPGSVERYFHWMSGGAGTWETWFTHRVLEPGETTTVTYSFVATQDTRNTVHADRHFVVGLSDAEVCTSLTLYSADVAGQATMELTHSRADGGARTETGRLQLSPGKTATMPLAAPIRCDQLSDLKVAITTGHHKASFSVPRVTYVDPTANPLPDPELKSYPGLSRFFPYGLQYSIEASGFHGRPRLWIGRHMRLWNRAGANTVHVCNSNLNMMRWFLPLAKTNGIRMIPGLHDFYGAGPGPRFGPHFVKPELLKRAIAPFAEHDGLLAWSIIDEPHTDFLRTFVEMRKAIESVDRQHPVTTITNYDGGNRGFAAFTSVLETDFYPSNRQANPWPVADWCERTDAWGDGRPHWFMAQGYRDELTPAAFRLQTFAALANNVKGLLYFIAVYAPRSHGHPKTMHDIWGNPSDLWPDFARIGLHLVGVGPALVSTRLVRPNPARVECETVKIRHRSRPAIKAGVRRDETLDADFVVVYNNELAAPREGDVALPGGPAKRVYDLFQLAEVKAEREAGELRFRVRFEPGDGAIYLCASPDVFRTVRGDALRNRFEHQRSRLRRDIEWAMDSGLQSWHTGSLTHKASVAAAQGDIDNALQLLTEDRRTLDALVSNNKPLVNVRDTLARVLSTLGDLDLAVYRAGIKRVLIEKRWQYVHGDGPARVVLTGTDLARLCRDLVSDVGNDAIALQCAYDSGCYAEIVESTQTLATELARFETALRAELTTFSADPAAYRR